MLLKILANITPLHPCKFKIAFRLIMNANGPVIGPIRQPAGRSQTAWKKDELKTVILDY
jgi:hypothetical protein